jgi:hypothetical protein
MVSLGAFFGVSCRVSYQDFLAPLGFIYDLSRGSFRIQTGQNKAKEKEKQRDSKERKQRSRGAGSRAAKTHD